MGSAENYYEKTNMIVGNIYQNNITSILNCIEKIKTNKSNEKYNEYINIINKLIINESRVRSRTK